MTMCTLGKVGSLEKIQCLSRNSHFWEGTDNILFSPIASDHHHDSPTILTAHTSPLGPFSHPPPHLVLPQKADSTPIHKRNPICPKKPKSFKSLTNITCTHLHAMHGTSPAQPTQLTPPPPFPF